MIQAWFSRIHIFLLRFRTYDKAYTRLTGHSWVECPICEREFGSHRVGEEMLYAEHNGMWFKCVVVCDDEWCQQEAVEQNSQFVVDMFQRQSAVRFLVLQPNCENIHYVDGDDRPHIQMGYEL